MLKLVEKAGLRVMQKFGLKIKQRQTYIGGFKISRLRCTCGASMSNSDKPSKNILRVFRDEDIRDAFLNSPDITLFDF